MGHQASSQQLKNQHGHKIQQRYHTNLFIKNKKTNSKFKEQLQSICKRSSYLEYEWAKELLTQLQRSNSNKLYTDYQSVLKENCLREGRKQKIFCPVNIKKKFIQNFTERLAKREIELSSTCLSELFEECKCYFMVMSWLHKMVALSANDQENNSGSVLEEWDQSQQQSIFKELLDFSEKVYRQSLKIPSQKTEIYRKEECSLNSNIMKLIKILITNSHKFMERQKIIGKIQHQLQADTENICSNIAHLKEIMGLDKIYAYLRTIKQVGHIDISFLWKYFGQQLQG